MKKLRFAVLDLYTDEPSGLGVPGYLGTYPRYVAGAILDNKHEYFYLTVDDLRKFVKEKVLVKRSKSELITDIKILNLSSNHENFEKILESIDAMIVIGGVHTPGKYLSALPGTTAEFLQLKEMLPDKLKDYATILTGPVSQAGSGLYGGKIARGVEAEFKNFDLVVPEIEYKFKELLENNFTSDVKKLYNYNELSRIAVLGADMLKQFPFFPDFAMVEIETGKGCKYGRCSFCTEPLKYGVVERRQMGDIVEEIKALRNAGARFFRLGKQTCFYSYGTSEEVDKLLINCRKYAEILHIDNANPTMVTEEKTKSIVKYCTPGNIAAFGVESWDMAVVKKNRLNTTPETTMKAIRLINKYGAVRGENGMPKFLPGINIIFGLNGESKKTHEENMFWFQKILDEGLMVRRINIRQVVPFPGTRLYDEAGNKFLKKNRSMYFRWRKDIREKVDVPMLRRLLPVGTVLRHVGTEIYDGNTTFARQAGTYPLVIGIRGRLPLRKYFDVKVADYMLRSVTAEMVGESGHIDYRIEEAGSNKNNGLIVDRDKIKIPLVNI